MQRTRQRRGSHAPRRETLDRDQLVRLMSDTLRFGRHYGAAPEVLNALRTAAERAGVKALFDEAMRDASGRLD